MKENEMNSVKAENTPNKPVEDNDSAAQKSEELLASVRETRILQLEAENAKLKTELEQYKRWWHESTKEVDKLKRVAASLYKLI